jgi:hypothetical protein
MPTSVVRRNIAARIPKSQLSLHTLGLLGQSRIQCHGSFKRQANAMYNTKKKQIRDLAFELSSTAQTMHLDVEVVYS